MVLALDLIQGIAHGAEEILVRGNDGAVELEFDDRLRPVDRVDLALRLDVRFFKLKLGQLLRCDVGRVLDDLVGLAVSIEDGIVARLQPNLAPAPGDALVLAGIELAAAELVPEHGGIRANS